MYGFAEFHPTVLFLYYVLLIVFTMFTVNPIIIGMVLFGGILFFASISRIKAVIQDLFFYFFVFLLIAVVNPLFSHNGETVIFFMNDNPVTLEAIVYGGVIAMMIVGVMFWCKCYNAVMTSDKFIYLFGKAIPRLSLVLSMALRFIPLFKLQIKKIHQSQKTMGIHASDSIPDKAMGSVRIFDSLLSWALENSLDTADAMKARGYGLPGRTDFSLFRFRRSDGILLSVIVLLSGVSCGAYIQGSFDFYYYPRIMYRDWSMISGIQYGAVMIFVMIPASIQVWSAVSWKMISIERKVSGNKAAAITPWGNRADEKMEDRD